MLGFHPLSVAPLSTLLQGQDELVITPAKLTAHGGFDRHVPLSWVSTMAGHPSLIAFELRRSTVSFPLTPSDGDLVYTGTETSFDDTDVVNHTRYYYTVFTRYEDSEDQPQYVTYSELSSDDAVPRLITVSQEKAEEYVPKRGEFGAVVSLPMPATSASVWGDILGRGREERDLVSAPLATPVFAPVSGVVNVVAAGENNLNIVYIDSDVGGFRFVLGQFKPLATTVARKRVHAGEYLGNLGGQPLEFSIVKLPTGRYGQRTVRPAYFYLMLEARDGRR